MKNPETNRKIILTMLSILSAFVVLRHEISNLNKTEWFIFDSFETLFWYSLGILIAIPTTISAFKSYKKTNQKIYFIPLSIIGIASILNLIVLSINKESESQVILWAHYDGDTNGLTLKLRADETYKLENYSILGGDFIEGKYRLENDTIYLDKKESLDNDFMNYKLVILENKVLFHVDKSGEYDTGFFSMRIIERK